MSVRKLLSYAAAGLLSLAVSVFLLWGQGAGATQEKTVKKVPITHSNPESGEQMFKDYCAACHGLAGKGDGPAAEILKAPPTDLTTMAKRTGGKFSQERFASVLRFGTGSHAHGTTDMPLWGPLFRSQNKDLVDLRIHNLGDYVESLQVK
jgi:mono/diheme cytochrome c family protein